MSAGSEKRNRRRVAFSREVPVRIEALDGSWSRRCIIVDVAEDGAKLLLRESLQALRLKEFLLILSTTGAPSRRCELAWINGDEVGVSFLKKLPSDPPSKARPGTNTHEI